MPNFCSPLFPARCLSLQLFDGFEQVILRLCKDSIPIATPWEQSDKIVGKEKVFTMCPA